MARTHNAFYEAGGSAVPEQLAAAAAITHPKTQQPAPAAPAQEEPRQAPADPHAGKSWGVRFFHHHVKPIAIVALVLLSVRSSVADWNDVPTGSMKPSIMEGDRIFVNKLAYDLKVPFTTWHLAEWGNPRRGEVVVFYCPEDGTRMVKRVIGVPGDVIELNNNQLSVNGQAATYAALAQDFINQIPASQRPALTFASEMTADGVAHPVMGMPCVMNPNRSFESRTVPAGKYFLMGDNRDNSRDSRWWGYADRDQIVGRAVGVAVSLDPEHSYKPRWGRFFKGLP
jgi:signal peptidase I